MVWAGDKTDTASEKNAKKTAEDGVSNPDTTESLKLSNDIGKTIRGDSFKDSVSMGTIKEIMSEELERPTEK